MNYVAVIPARGGSKGIKDKNLQLVGQHSLVARAILVAKEVNCIDKVIVSTDSDKIAQEAIAYGALVHKRSAKNSGDFAKTIDVLKEMIEDMGLQNDICVLLQPTSPLRDSQDVLRAIRQYEENYQQGSVATVVSSEYHPFKMIVKTDLGFVPVTILSDLEEPRQKLPKAFRVNGAVYVIAFYDLLKEQSFFVQPQAFIEMSEQNSIDIDTYTDLQRANQMLDLMIKGNDL